MKEHGSKKSHAHHPKGHDAKNHGAQVRQEAGDTPKSEHLINKTINKGHKLSRDHGNAGHAERHHQRVHRKKGSSLTHPHSELNPA